MGCWGPNSDVDKQPAACADIDHLLNLQQKSQFQHVCSNRKLRHKLSKVYENLNFEKGFQTGTTKMALSASPIATKSQSQGLEPRGMRVSVLNPIWVNLNFY